MHTVFRPLVAVYALALTACGSTNQWSLNLADLLSKNPEANGSSPTESLYVWNQAEAQTTSALEPQLASHLQDLASRQVLGQMLERAGIDAWEHPEIARALGQSDEALPVADMLRRREEILRAIPQTMPADGYVSSLYGERLAPGAEHTSLHKGLDIAAAEGTPIYAPADGVVRFAGRYGGFGNYLALVHGYGLVTKYAHTQELLVQAGARVKRGDLIARVGGSGRSRGVHLHYEVWLNDKAVDPAAFLPPGSIGKPSGNSMLVAQSSSAQNSSTRSISMRAFDP